MKQKTSLLLSKTKFNMQLIITLVGLAFAIAAAVIGGASLSGGKGNMLGTIIGAFIIGILNNGLNLIGLSSFWQQVAVGCVIILAVFLDVIRVKFKNN